MSARQIQLLQKQLQARRRPEKDLAIGAMVKSIAGQARQTQSRLGDLIELWESTIPPALAARTRITTLRAGVLHVDTDSPATLYDLDRMLRSGTQDQLRAAYRGTLIRVKLKVSALGESVRT